MDFCFKHDFTQQVSFLNQQTTSLIITTNISYYLKQTLEAINAKTCVLITDNNVKEKVLPSLHKELKSLPFVVHLLSFPAGETHKTEKVKTYLETALSNLIIDKNTLIIALGGGVVSDLVGFVAATYYRGLPLINIPTTLLGMIDASIGGKVGINTSFGKNMIGCIKHPLVTLINIKFLRTLPQEELRNGLSEAIKYALISSPQLFSFIKSNYKKLLHHPLEHFSLLHTVIKTCCQIKLHIVSQDQNDIGIRKILNFGHTTAHALETLSQHQISHGKAVALGMKVATLLSAEQGFLSSLQAQEILSFLNTFYKNETLSFSISSLQKVMLFDKKNTSNAIHFILLKNLGEVMSFNENFSSPVPQPLLESVLKQILY